MAIRTTSALVQGVLGADYGQKPSGELPSLTPYIRIANQVTDRVATAAVDNKNITLTSAELEVIETWLAAHFYTKMDPVYTSKSTGGASGSFVRGKTEPEPYKDGAIAADYSGCVNAILNRFFASANWLGKAPSEQIPYWQRD